MAVIMANSPPIMHKSHVPERTIFALRHIQRVVNALFEHSHYESLEPTRTRLSPVRIGTIFDICGGSLSLP